MKKNKLIAILTLMCFLFTLMPVAAMAESTLPDDWTGCTSCSESNPHMIATTADLDKIRTHIKDNKITGCFKLANDIIFAESDFQVNGAYYNEGQTWISIGHTNLSGDNGIGQAFCGIFDGDNKMIKGLKMEPSDSSKRNRRRYAVFSQLGESGVIKNVVFDSVTNTTKHGAAIVVGEMISEKATLKNIAIKGCSVVPGETSNNGWAPSLLAFALKGKVENITIENCTFGGGSGAPHYACVVATQMNGVHIDGLKIKDTNYKLYAYVKLFANIILGTNIVENVTISNVYIENTHNSGFPLPLVGSIASTNSLSLKNVNCTIVHKLTDREGGYILPANTSVTMENCAFHIIADGKDASAYWITNDDKGTWKDISGDLKLTLGKKENGVVTDTTDMQIVDGIYYVNKTNVTTWRDDEIVAYLNGGTFNDETEFTEGKLATPIKEGYTVQWCKDETLTISVSDDDPTEGNSYYAKWTLCDHTANTAIDCVNPTACSECGAAIAPVGHDFANGTWINNNPDGHYKQCVRCTVTDSMSDHEYDGHTDITCNVCDYERSLVHDFTNGTWVTTDAAYHWKVCKDCDAQDTENKAEHSYTYTSSETSHSGICVCGRTVTNEEHEYTNACDTDCNVCGYVRTIEHDYEWIVDKAATEYETGLKHEKCTICDVVRNVDTVIEKLPSTQSPSTSSSSGFTGSYNYPVSIPTVDNGDVKLSDSNAVAGESVTATVTPDNGYGVSEVIVTDEDGNIIPVEFIGNGQYTFVMPAGKVNIETICKPAIIMTIGDTELNIFGKTVKNDVAPTIGEGNRTMLPIRAVANALGAEVYWDADNQKVTIVKDGKVIEVFIGKDYAFVDGERIELDAKAYIENDRTYLQVRFVTEALDAEVIWDPVKRMVTIIPE